MIRILIIEDETATRTILKDLVSSLGEIKVEETPFACKGLELTTEFEPDLIILDLNLPDMSGLRVAKTIRSKSDFYGNPHILMLTANTATEDVLNGFEKGADDYLRKPFDHAELLFRVRSLLNRRGKGSHSSQVYKYADLIVDEFKSQVKESGIEVKIPKKEFALLSYFIVNKGITLSRERLLDEIWDMPYYSNNRTVDMAVNRLKSKLKTINKNLVSVRGFGYQLKKI